MNVLRKKIYDLLHHNIMCKWLVFTPYSFIHLSYIIFYICLTCRCCIPIVISELCYVVTHCIYLYILAALYIYYIKQL